MPLLVTSRHRFPLDEIVEIAELKPTQALKLLSLHARGRNFADDPDALRLCEVLGYHAFALEIASKSLKVYQLTPAELLRQIEDAPHDLTMPANFGELGRAGIKSLLDASVSALHKALYDTFVAFGGMFEPSSTAELLALAMRLDVTEAEQSLSQLELRGLVNARTYNQIVYYRLHDLAYSYARTLFLNKGLHHQAVIQACREYTAIHKDDLDALEVEQSNILEAAEAASQSEQDSFFIDIMRLLTVDGSYFAARGHTALSIHLLKAAIETARQRGELETAHFLLSRLGNAYADFFGDYESALKSYEEALELARRLGNQRREAILLTVIAKMHFHQNIDGSDAYYNQAEVIARSTDDLFALSFVLHHRGYQLINKPQPDYERGRQISDEAAKIATKLELVDIQFWSLLNRGSSEHELGQLEQALATHLEAYEIAQRQNNHYWMAGVLRSIGEDHHKMGNLEQAQQAFNESLIRWRHVKAKSQIADLIQYMSDRNYAVTPEE
jgi:tetratricopeptide (TPR) repeat protein